MLLPNMFSSHTFLIKVKSSIGTQWWVWLPVIWAGVALVIRFAAPSKFFCKLFFLEKKKNKKERPSMPTQKQRKLSIYSSLLFYLTVSALMLIWFLVILLSSVKRDLNITFAVCGKFILLRKKNYYSSTISFYEQDIHIWPNSAEHSVLHGGFCKLSAR